MAITTAQFAIDRAAVVADIPVAVTFGTGATQTTVNCRKTVLNDTDRAAAAGELKNYAFSLRSVTADWTTAPGVAVPAVGNLVTVASVEYRVLRVKTGNTGTWLDVGSKYTQDVR